MVNVAVLPSMTAVEFGCVDIDITRRTVSSPCDDVIGAAEPNRETTAL